MIRCNLRDTGYEFELPADLFREYEEQVLSSGLCDFSLPMQFTPNGENVRVEYECSGYISIGDFNFRYEKEVFEIIEKSLSALRKAEEFLIDQRKIFFSPSSVYFHCRKRTVRIAYVPVTECPIQHKMVGFLYELEVLLRGKEELENAVTKIETLKKEIMSDNLNIEDTISRVRILRKELR